MSRGIHDDSDIEEFDDEFDVSDDVKDRHAGISLGGVIAFFFILALIAVSGFFAYKYFAGRKGAKSKEVKVSYEELYKSAESFVALSVMGDRIEADGIYVSGDRDYIRLDILKELGSHAYYDNDSDSVLVYYKDDVLNLKKDADYVAVSDKLYVALDKLNGHNNPYVLEKYDSPLRYVVYGYKAQSAYKACSAKSKVRLYTAASSLEYYMDIPKGERVTCIGSEGDHKKIEYKGVAGYVKADSLGACEAKKFYTYEAWKEPAASQVKLGFASVSVKEANNYVMTYVSASKGLNTISPTWYYISDEEGTVESLVDKSVCNQLKNAGYKVWPLISDFEKDIDNKNWIGSSKKRKKVIDKLVSDAVTYGYDGYNIDFEKVNGCKEDYIQFLRELSKACPKLTLSASVYGNIPMYQIAEVLDYVVIMQYDEHYAGSEEPGSVSSISFVKKGLDDAVKEGVPAGKIISALPFYYRIWTATTEDGKLKRDSKVVKESNASGYLEAHQSDAIFDEETGQYYIYYEEGKTSYMCWLEEARSLSVKLEAVKSYGVGGVAFWRLGYEDPAIYDDLWKAYDAN